MALARLNATTLGHQRAAHLLRRATFGATKAQIDQLAAKSPDEAIQMLFHSSLPDPELPIDPKTGTEWFTNGTTDANSENGDLENYFLGWIIGQMLATKQSPDIILPYSARERIVHFLHTHFTTIRSRVSSSRALYFQNKLFRLFALDNNGDTTINFKNLTVKISVDNAMLRLLDGSLNVKGSVNENYARELLELYSIGRGLEGQGFPTTEQGDYRVYKEQDVRAAAAVLSGWDFDDTFLNVDADTEIPRGKVKGDSLNASAHDNSVKQFSQRLSNASIQPDPLLISPNGNATEASALDEIRQLIDLIYAQDETSRNICRKIYRFYVWAPHTRGEMSPIEDSIITEMVNVFRAGGFKIQPVIEDLLLSEHFYEAGTEISDDNFGGMIKSPLDVMLGALQFFNVKLPDMTASPADFYMQTSEIVNELGSMGMSFYEPYDVAGYEAYHQFPVYHRFWITPNALTRRYDFIRNIVTRDNNGMFGIDAYEYIQENFNQEAPDANALVLTLAKYLLPVSDTIDFTNPESSITQQRLNYFKAKLLGGFDDDYWTKIWNGTSLDDKRLALESLLNAMMQSPEYQLA